MKILDRFYEKFPGSYIAYIGFTFSVIFMSIAIILYDDPNFTIFTHFISDLGASTKGSYIFWSINMILTVPIRLLYGIYLLKFLEKRGANKKTIKVTIAFMLISGFGSILIALNPHDVSRLLHLIGAFTYFIGVVVIAFYMLFLGFEISEIISESFRLLACFFEWMAYFALMAWLILHGVYTHISK